ncbi:MAG: hypothetical protein AB1665_01660, partial [Candidatus Thermoplasmatota archaeon]
CGTTGGVALALLPKRLSVGRRACPYIGVQVINLSLLCYTPLVWMDAKPDGTIIQHYVNGTKSDPLDAQNINWYNPITKTWIDTSGNTIKGRDLDTDGIPDWAEASANTTARKDKDHPLFWYCGYDEYPWLPGMKFYRHDWQNISNQFNPFVKENIPPKIENVGITKHESWGWVEVVWPLSIWTCEHAWTEIDVYVTDVAPYTIKIGVTDRNSYLTFTGAGNQYNEKHHAVIDLDYWDDILWDYTVNVTIKDKSDNKAFFEKKINGPFGGALDFLKDIWNAIVGAFMAAWEAVLSAVNWIFDYVWEIVNYTINTLFAPIIQAINNWIESFINRLTEVFGKIASDFESIYNGKSVAQVMQGSEPQLTGEPTLMIIEFLEEFFGWRSTLTWGLMALSIGILAGMAISNIFGISALISTLASVAITFILGLALEYIFEGFVQNALKFISDIMGSFYVGAIAEATAAIAFFITLMSWLGAEPHAGIPASTSSLIYSLISLVIAIVSIVSTNEALPIRILVSGVSLLFASLSMKNALKAKEDKIVYGGICGIMSWIALSISAPLFTSQLGLAILEV